VEEEERRNQTTSNRRPANSPLVGLIALAINLLASRIVFGEDQIALFLQGEIAGGFVSCAPDRSRQSDVRFFRAEAMHHDQHRESLGVQHPIERLCSKVREQLKPVRVRADPARWILTAADRSGQTKQEGNSQVRLRQI
jgi:hypothetical protein